MANIRSAEKQRRQAEKKKARNRATSTRLKTALKKAKSTIAAGKADVALLSATSSVIDKAAKKGVIKKNTADRYKSRLAKGAKRASTTAAK